MSDETPEVKLYISQDCDSKWLEFLCEKFRIHTYEALNGKGWIAAVNKLRGRGETRREAEINLLNNMGLFDEEEK